MPITTRQKLGSKFGMVHRAIAGVFILAVFASASVTSDRSLQCVARLAGEPGRDCFAAGLVSPGSEHVYQYDIDRDTPESDIVITISGGNLEVLVGSGTPGPVVAVPVATQRTILRTRDLIHETQKTLSITVRAVVSATSYALDIATQNGPAELQPQDELALRSLARGVDGCCTQPGTCKQLKELLAGSTPLLALCYRDGNLCDTDGRLLSLDLSHQDLGCANVPHQSLGQLSSLQLLDLTGTGLTGHVSGLVTLVRSLPDLRGIRAAHNELAGALDCALLAPGLSELDLAGNRLSGSVPPCFLSSQSLHHLRLSHNALAGELPTPTEACGLHTVRLDHMQLRGPLPDLSGASRLSVADLSHNRLTQPRKAAWPALLRSLRLAGNGLDESALRLPPWLAGATREASRSVAEELLQRAIQAHAGPSGDRPTAPGGPSAGPAGLWASAAAGVALAVAALLSIVLVGTLGFNARAALQRSASSAPAPLSTIAEEESAPLSPAEEACTSARPVAELSEAGSDIRAYASAENLAPASSAEQELVFRRVQAIRRKATASSDDERAYAESAHAAVARKISNKSDISDGLHADLEEENSSDGLRIRAWVKDANAKKDD